MDTHEAGDYAQYMLAYMSIYSTYSMQDLYLLIMDKCMLKTVF